MGSGLSSYQIIHSYSSQNGHGLEAKIGKDYFSWSKISLTDLTAFPAFFRVDRVSVLFPCPRVSLSAHFDTPTIGEMCQLFVNQLQLIKPTLDGSHLFFYGLIDKANCKPSSFHDHTEVADFLRNRLLTICDKSRQCAFVVELEPDVSAATKCAIISSILQMPQIDQCSDVSINFWNNDYYQLQLPVEEISKWLNRKLSGKEMRSLRIKDDYEIGNMLEMFDHLKKVLYFIN